MFRWAKLFAEEQAEWGRKIMTRKWQASFPGADSEIEIPVKGAF